MHSLLSLTAHSILCVCHRLSSLNVAPELCVQIFCSSSNRFRWVLGANSGFIQVGPVGFSMLEPRSLHFLGQETSTIARLMEFSCQNVFELQSDSQIGNRRFQRHSKPSNFRHCFDPAQATPVLGNSIRKLEKVKIVEP